MQPRLTVSGYRGVWGETLTGEIACEYARAFAHFVRRRAGRTVMVGRDGRASGVALVAAVAAELARNGIDVIDLGLIPTPTVLFLVRSEKADGAIIVTASHNPIEYNGLKFVTSTALFTTEEEVIELDELRTEPPYMTDVASGTHISATDFFDKHLSALLSHIDADCIRKADFKVALDPINSVGCTTTPKLFEALGVRSVVINGEPDGQFAHEPEPLPRNLTELRSVVLAEHCAAGFAQDPDGDRLVLCDETGTVLSEESTLALCLIAILRKTPGNTVINMSTSNRSEDATADFGGITFRSKVGEANVVAGIMEKHAVAGGEGGGGVIWPAVNMARDSFVGIALVLELMAAMGKPLSELAGLLAPYSMVKEKVSYSGSTETLYSRLKETFTGCTCNDRDGLRFDFPDRSWVHVRPSNTEPYLRIIAEALSKEAAEALAIRAKDATIS